MSDDGHAIAEETPLLVYDDDCGFCTYWVEYVANRSPLDVVGFSEMSDAVHERLPEDYERGAHLLTGEKIYSFGESMEEAFLRTETGSSLAPVVDFLREYDEYVQLRESTYRWVSENRNLLGRIVRREPPARIRRDE